jgi:hypothetical protein
VNTFTVSSYASTRSTRPTKSIFFLNLHKTTSTMNFIVTPLDSLHHLKDALTVKIIAYEQGALLLAGLWVSTIAIYLMLERRWHDYDLVLGFLTCMLTLRGAAITFMWLTTKEGVDSPLSLHLFLLIGHAFFYFLSIVVLWIFAALFVDHFSGLGDIHARQMSPLRTALAFILLFVNPTDEENFEFFD